MCSGTEDFRDIQLQPKNIHINQFKKVICYNMKGFLCMYMAEITLVDYIHILWLILF